eukprot:c12458_g1_i1.p1 GENE.c12458_g1_i1~~c12458_g1_i1.p1  ORF type:complete len:198 (+),score=38.77 c12458_g1_i1:1-594(+)
MGAGAMPRPGIKHDEFLRELPSDIHVSSGDALPTSRSKCSKCSKSRLWFCPDCLVVMGSADAIPNVKLPLPVDIIHHPTEKLSKSSAPHVALMSKDIALLDYPNVPEYDKSKTLLLYPSQEAKSVSEINLGDYNKVVFVDCTWTQAITIMGHANLQGLTHVKLEAQETAFWRFLSFLPPQNTFFLPKTKHKTQTYTS